MAEQSLNTSETTTGRQVTFSMVYRSPTNAPFEQHVTVDTADKTAHLQELRKTNKELQARINESLTVRMEEDRIREGKDVGTVAARRKKAGIDEAMEEDNYGEEVPEVDG